METSKWTRAQTSSWLLWHVSAFVHARVPSSPVGLHGVEKRWSLTQSDPKTQRKMEGFHKRGTPNGWFISWKIPISNGCELGLAQIIRKPLKSASVDFPPKKKGKQRMFSASHVRRCALTTPFLAPWTTRAKVSVALVLNFSLVTWRSARKKSSNMGWSTKKWTEKLCKRKNRWQSCLPPWGSSAHKQRAQAWSPGRRQRQIWINSDSEKKTD